jgi:luciferase family oxidoreductase group 1
MQLSILDQAPISNNQTAQEALQSSLELALAGDRLGYVRFWIAEHHDLLGLACSAPEVMLSYIGAHTKNIRIGSGAVLLPHYKPYKVAEVFNMLATLFPNRIDIGIGRAPGGSAEATEALSDQFLQKVWDMPNLVEELLHFLYRDFPGEHRFSSLKAMPQPEVVPETWLLGTSKKSALLAAKNGLDYAFGQFMSDENGAKIIQQYKKDFKPRFPHQKPKCSVTVSVFCAETKEEAEEIALSSLIWSMTREKSGRVGVPSIEEAKRYTMNQLEREKLEKMKQKMIIGDPQMVKESLYLLKERYQADEIMIVTITHSLSDKIKSYELISESILGEIKKK